MSTVQIAAKDVAALRARTGAGMGDCKKALEEAGGDPEKALDILRTKGIAKADKRAGRAASEGQITIWLSDDRSAGAMVELNCETDFVARTEEFVALAQAVAADVAHDPGVDGIVEVGAGHALLGRPWSGDPSRTLGDAIKGAAAKTGENVSLRRVARFSTRGTLGAYRHHNGKVAVLAEVTSATGDAARQLAYSVAEHVAAGVPTVAVAVRKADVPAALVERERAIFAAQAKASGKPDAIVEKMVAGRLDKYFKEITLLEQPWVRDDGKTIGQLVRETSGADVARFARFQMGEA